MKTLFRLGLLALPLALAACAGSGTTGSMTADTGDGPVVAMVGGQPISLGEFERQYLRSAADTVAAISDSEEAYQEFLDRYVDFKLKVLEAERLGYGDRPELAQELRQYKSQLARPYLLEREVMEPLIRQLYERRKDMVDASHILLRLAENAVPGDTMRTWQKLASIADSIRAGADFAEMARKHSEDPSARGPEGSTGEGGHLGFFSGGRMVKPFEDAMYSTPVGELSGIIRTQFGYHLLYIHARRPTVPDLRISHIMIQPRGAAPEDTLAAWDRLQSALDSLRSGVEFADVARQFSDDGQSSSRGGDLDFVSYDGWLPAEMRDAVFGSDSLGTVVGPVRTRFGWHVMKITDRREPLSFEASYDALQAEITRLPRVNSAEVAYARSLRRMRGSTIDSSLAAMLIGTRSVDSLMTQLRNGSLPADLRSRQFVTLGDSSYTLDQFGQYVASSAAAGIGATEYFWRTVDAFLENQAIEYEINALEARDAEFARTMTEFRDGLMLFRLMEDSVWTAATQDSVGLMKWYDAHAGEYQYAERTRIVGFYATVDSVLSSIAERLSGGVSLSAIVEEAKADTVVSIRVDTTLVEGRTDSVFDRALDLETGGSTGVLSFGGGRVVLVNDGIEAPRPKTFQEARAEVANAWQDRLEARLVARLRERYAVRTNPEVLATAFSRLRMNAR